MAKFKDHWEKIYSTKGVNEVSWTQEVPQTSLDFIRGYNLPRNAAIIDIGGGESKLVDFLLDEGYTNITVLDISAQALAKTQMRLGERAARVRWVVSDVTEFKPEQMFDVWHDRATFHFLTTKEQIEKYIELAASFVNEKGFMAIGTFSENGPTKCSGLEIKQYSEAELEKTLRYHFKKIRCLTEDHITPFKTTQNFLFCSFKKAA
ncbi:class I SAM-dependent methyltransferase [Chryseolinea lacunae]|uniref:Class I SAM-dependent methyltransferase n=1 Tax=Chryseolinea lacunae TaxID=2801331 RepID=A0ABS1KYW6_9BACT|nr:class I SAM-dependent methyltransferase [Chryseolinea lacunae]MBL0744473.1 class I SAM-dependent methyltransferase [Chryseolinea lacunae]